MMNWGGGRTGYILYPVPPLVFQRYRPWSTHTAARMIYRASRYDHVLSLLKELHWLRVPERIEFKLCALVYKCLNGNGAAYLADSLQRVTDVKSRRRLQSSSSSTLIVPVTRRATLGDRALPVVAARAWNVSAQLLIIPYSVEDVSVFPDLLTLTTCVTLTL